MIYLDYNATTPVAPEVRQTLLPFLEEHFGNPASTHPLGRACRQGVEDARARVARLLGAEPDEIVFTSGGTESNNLALQGIARQHAPQGGHLVVSSLDHRSIIEPARFLESQGYQLTIVPCTPEGVIEPEAVEAALRPDTFLVSVVHANNEIGTIQPIRQISHLCRSAGVLVHTDAAQSAGKIPVRVEELGVDLLSLAGHKFYAPKGAGALYVRRGVFLSPLLHGSGQEAGRRAGTENVPGIVGLGAAARLAAGRLDQYGTQVLLLHERLATRLREVIGESLSINGQNAERLPNTLSVNFPSVVGSELLERAGVYASTGAACHAGLTSLSPTSAAIGLAPEVARGTVRLSLGWETTEEEVDRAADWLLAAWESLQE